MKMHAAMTTTLATTLVAAMMVAGMMVAGMATVEGARVPCGGAWMWDSKEACEARHCVWEPSAKTLNWCVYNSSWTERIEHVHVVQGCHFDAGFAGTVDAIVRRWFGFFDQAYHTGMQLEQNSTDPAARLAFTAQSWVVWLYLNCPSDLNLTCPDDAALRRFNTSVAKGWITWQAFPFDAELELLSPTTLRLAFELTHALDAQFGLKPKRVLSQRDVPGIPRAALHPLASSGVRAVSVGTNGGSTPPNVPRVFLWKDEQTQTSMLTMYLTGGYGGFNKLPGVFVPTVVPGSTHAMVVAWRGDNSGPASADEVIKDLAEIRKEFPNAAVNVSTFDAFVSAIDTPQVRSQLPTITDEIGDSWIHGVASDTGKLAQLTAMQRAIDTWCARAPSHCTFTNAHVSTFIHRFLKNSEHTWGLDVKSTISPRSALHANYSNPDFHRARQHNPQYAKLEASWQRQRRWGIANALKHLHDDDLRALVEQELAAVNTTFVDLTGYSPEQEDLAVIAAQGWRVAINTTSTAIVSIINKDRSLIGADAQLGLMQYRTYTAQNYTHFMLNYNFAGPLFPVDDLDDFDKVGINKVPAVYRSVASVGNGTTFRRAASLVTPSMLADPSAVTDAGGFASAFTNYTLVSANQSTLVLRGDITLKDKTATRLPEALFVRFRLPNMCGGDDASKDAMSRNAGHDGDGVGSDADCDRGDTGPGWTLTKLGNHTLDPRHVVDGGAKHNHVVTSFSCLDGSGVRVTITPLTSPLVSVGEPTPFPTPVRGQPTMREGVAMLVLNNIWNTNYRMWQGGDFRLSFIVTVQLHVPQ
ncbi:hypothetical protein PTSG_08199 [Salpingoeca rosetta]|uniref:P-type domain-containing protein n=1 Tax=Salpingoeca rosetta (strain ATCC 50818 / BSB-021) TaxID=946362 RepID=F2UIA2_SALR5|nr:uncharacterized protein PTSG_08199 [Salpingoeca rosetta]EGD76851.1 hypothetical protein PTSG_08199 [Salpingoeca rosetta]|eukprot:XP_004991223.1 hypothetical protein PTSG_08199 [Salpingoeca rosetta]